MRQLPADTPTGELAKGYRQDSESLDSQAEKAWTTMERRLPAWGATNQAFRMFGFALLQNSISRCVYRRRVRSELPDEPPAAAAA